MKVLFAGTPGVCKSSVLRRLELECKRRYPDRRIFTAILDRRLYTNQPIAFLKRPSYIQKEAWRSAFNKLRQEFYDSKADHCFLGIHCTYRFDQIPRCNLDFSALCTWRPDCIVTLIDDVYCVRDRIHRGRHTSFSIAELVQWRAEELLVGDLLARAIDSANPPPNYVIAVKHPVAMLAELLFGQVPPLRVYTSYSITDTRNNRHQRKIIDYFRQKISKRSSLVVFDPLTIDELPPLIRAARSRKKQKTISYHVSRADDRWPIAQTKALASDRDVQSKQVLRVPLPEAQYARGAVDAQVADRDYRLIDQSHAVVVFRPTLGGRRALSQGVHAEVEYASHVGRPIVWYFKRGEDSIPESPFIQGDPGSDPNIVFDRDERLVWTQLSEIRESLPRDGDHFLR